MALDFLVVDKSPAMRRMIHRTLRMGKLQVDHIHEAGTVDEARNLLDEYWVDGIIADWDIWMNEDTRFVVWLTNNEVLHNIPLLTVTSDGRPDAIEEVSRQDISFVLVKPFYPEELYNKVTAFKTYERE